MKHLFHHTAAFLGILIFFITCTKDTHFNPTEEIGVTIEAYACDTTDLDTTITLADSLTGTVTALSVYAGQTITFLGFIKGNSVNDITWSWDFGDTVTSLSRIVEHRYMAPGEYKAVFTITNSVEVSLSDTVYISASGIYPHAAVKGYAFFQGKNEHDSIEVLLKSTISTLPILTLKSGLYQMLKNVPAGAYTIYFTDKKTGRFSSDTLENVTIINGILNELGKTSLKGLPPTADAGNNTTAGFGSTINLNGTAIDNGTIVKWEWKIGDNPWVETSSGDTSFIPPRIPKMYVCSLRVTDDDGEVGIDYVNIDIKVIFTSHTIMSSADSALSVFAIDVDVDGDIDVLSASWSKNKIEWYENDGTENFTSHIITSTADFANSVFAIDVDGDGDIDVLSSSWGTIAWYENDGSENFTSYIITDSADGPGSVYAVDVDGDGDIDVLSAAGSKIEWYENDGSESFTAHTITTSANGASSVFSIDIDGDGDIDVLFASWSDNKIAWYENDGAENFTDHTITTSADGATSVFAIDIEGDGDIDVLSASQSDNKIAWYENDGVENFTNHTITTSANDASSVFSLDVDGDSDIDVLSASSVIDNKIAWYENDGAENFNAHTISTSDNGAKSVFAIDVDGDGDIDVLSASSGDNKIAWYENGD